jgi:hypothetical protein
MRGQIRALRLSAAAVLVVGTAALTALVGIGVAAAVSTGGYAPAKQGCSPTADANSPLQKPEGPGEGASDPPGSDTGTDAAVQHTGTAHGQDKGSEGGGSPTYNCHNSQVLVTDSSGHDYVEAGTLQEAPGDNVHAGTLMVSPDGSASPNGTATGSGIGGFFDTNYQPIPAGQCGLEDIALYAVEQAQDLATGSTSCTLDPTKWSAPSAAPTVTPVVQAGSGSPDAAALLTGGEIYLGADDNLDTGEHDGINGQYDSLGSANGPSDGGSFSVDWQPQAGVDEAMGWQGIVMTALTGQSLADLAPFATDPFPFANAGGGACADGICFGVYSSQRTLYRGGGGGGAQRNAYDYSGKDFGPYDCNSGSPANEQACQTEPGSNGQTLDGMDAYRQAEASQVTSEPGVMVYADPDPQSSPVLPSQLYPLPAGYVGTCGATVGSSAITGGAPAPPSNPLVTQNSAGQFQSTPTGC